MGQIAVRIERESLVLLISIMVVIVFMGVIVRRTPITGQTLWTEELARLFLLWVTFMAAGSVERVGGHFRFDLLDKRLSSRVWLFVQLSIKLVLLVSLGVLVWTTIEYSVDMRGVQTLFLQWPSTLRSVPLVFAGLLMFAHMVTSFIRLFRRLFE